MRILGIEITRDMSHDKGPTSDWWYLPPGGLFSSTRNGATPEAAEALGAVISCRRAICESIATLPVQTYRYLDDDQRRRTKDKENDVWRLFRYRPNSIQSPVDFIDIMQAHLLLRGNAYAQIVFNNAGRILEIIPLDPRKMSVSVALQNGELITIYNYTMKNGAQITFPQEAIFHLRYLSDDGVCGRSPISMATDVFTTGMNADKFSSNFFGNSARPGGILQYPGQLDDESRANLKKSWYDNQGGIANVNKLAILEEGIQFKEVGLSPEDAQLIETKKFSAIQIAGIFRVPPHMIGILDGATFSNMEQMALEFVTNTLRPWFVRWEQEILIKLHGAQGNQNTHYTKFNASALLRGDLKSRFDSYAIGRQWGWLTANDILEKEDEDLLPGDQGDIALVPLNMVPADLVYDVFAKQQAKAAATGAPEAPASAPSTPAGGGTQAKSERFEYKETAFEVPKASLVRPILADAMARVVNKETKALAFAAKKNSAKVFEEKAEKLYSEMGDYISSVMLAPTTLMAGKSTEETAAILSRFSENYLKTSRDTLSDVASSAINANFGKVVEALIEDWRVERVQIEVQKLINMLEIGG